MRFSTALRLVSRLLPGQEIILDTRFIECNPGSGFSVADWILENIIGSAYEYYYVNNPQRRTTVFGRRLKLTEDGFYSYVSPDRRHRYNQLLNGLYVHKEGS